METLALILAGGKGSRLDILSNKRSKPAMPFAGKYRIIDFPLSNCSQSGIYNIAILTQYLPLSLNEHIGSGRPWDLDRNDARVTLLQPHDDWYLGTADAVLKNLEFIGRKKPKYVLILSGDHIYKMDYRKMIDVHVKKNAKLTIAAKPVPKEDANRFGMIGVDENDSVIDFIEKPEHTDYELASMGIYLFDYDLLNEVLTSVKEKELDFGNHIIPYLIKNTKDLVFAYRFNGYWQDVGTYDSYLDCNLALNNIWMPIDLYDPTWKVFTRSKDMPPVKVTDQANVTNSLISNGCVIDGTVINSVLSPGVRVSKGAVVKDSVILNDTIISDNVFIQRAIIDKQVVIGHNTQIGISDDFTANIERPDLLSSGIVVIEKKTVIPSGVRIGRNVRIFKDGVINTDFVPSGSTIK